jgi:hypothetical protein
MRTRSLGLAAATALALSPVISPATADEPEPAQPAADSAPVPLAEPFPKTWAILPWGALADTSDENIERIATAYDWINTHGGSWFDNTALPFGDGVADRLHALNPDMILTSYRNGGYTNQFAGDEAGEVEQQIPLAIAVHDTAAWLTADVTAGQTTLLFQPPPGPVDNRVPPAARPIYPFKASTTDEQYSIDKHAYVAWLRLGDEIVRIDQAQATPDGKIELTVVRGYWGTTATEHTTDDVVLQPIYNGRVMPNGNEALLSGVPDGNGGQFALRYVMQQQDPGYWQWLGDKVGELFDQGYDGPWFDTSTSEWINQGNAYGVPERIPYDVDLGRNLDNETFREYQQQKLDAMFGQYPDEEFYVNWNFPRHYFDNGTERLMFSGENGYHPISGGAIEQFANQQFMDWFQTMDMVFDMVANDYRGVAWTKGLGMTPTYQHFAYATYLIAYEQDSELYFGIDPDPADPQTPSIYPDIPRPDFQSVVPDPPDYVYWDLGRPAESFTDVAQAELAEAPGVYGREFTCGRVLVNPDATRTPQVNLNRSYYDAVAEEQVTSVTLAPRSATVLLDPCSDDVPVPGACTDVVTGDVRRPLTVSSGVTCLSGATVYGPVQVAAGAGLVAQDSRISGPVIADGAAGLTLCDTTVSGPLTSVGSDSVVLGYPEADCGPNTISGPVVVSGTQGLSVLAGNTVNGPLICTGNVPAPGDRGLANDVRGPATGQCASLE